VKGTVLQITHSFPGLIALRCARLALRRSENENHSALLFPPGCLAFECREATIIKQATTFPETEVADLNGWILFVSRPFNKNDGGLRTLGDSAGGVAGRSPAIRAAERSAQASCRPARVRSQSPGISSESPPPGLATSHRQEKFLLFPQWIKRGVPPHYPALNQRPITVSNRFSRCDRFVTQ
jgi:hypothetical protein